MYFLSVFTVCCILSTTMASEVSRVVEGNNKFGTNCFKIASRDEGNVLISPYSAHVVLSMALQGAGGDTATSMTTVLGVDAPTAADEYQKLSHQISTVKSVILKTANKVYLMEKFKLKPHFKEMVETKFLSEVDEMDFSENEKSAATINGWVEEKTNNKIKDLIKADMLDGMTRLVLVNAVYFKGNWEKKFNKDHTTKQPFYLLNGEEVQVDMMHLNNAKLRYSENPELDCKILEMPYEGNELSMVVFLPNQRDGITNLQEKLEHVNITDVLQDLHQLTVNLALPKFKIESTIQMKKMLEELGAGIIFSDKADFSGIAESGEQLKVSEVVQKTFIEVNEEGAEAAAATGVIMMTRCMPMPMRQVSFVADHPFLVALIHKTGRDHTILFFGRLSSLQEN